MTNKHEMRIGVWILVILTMFSLVYALAGNNIVSEVRQFTVNNPPRITILSPENNTRWTTSFNVSFTYNVSDLGDTIVNCSLYINNILNASNESAVAQNQNLTINLTLANGNYNWSIHCLDDGGMEGISETWNLTIDHTVLSITVVDTLIDWGACYPNPSTGTWYDSNDTSKAGTGIGLCTGLINPQNLTVENNGNIAANVSIEVDSTDLTGGTNPELWFAAQNSTSRPGCFEGLKQSWVNFTAANTSFVVCDGLNATDNFDQFWTFLRVFAPPDSVFGTRIVIITFIAQAYE